MQEVAALTQTHTYTHADAHTGAACLETEPQSLCSVAEQKKAGSLAKGADIMCSLAASGSAELNAVSASFLSVLQVSRQQVPPSKCPLKSVCFLQTEAEILQQLAKKKLF